MPTQVDLSYLCTAFSVDERALQRTLQVLIEVGSVPCSIESLAERASYSPIHMTRIVRALAWHNDLNPPIVFRRGGKRGIPYRHDVNRERAYQLGLHDAA